VIVAVNMATLAILVFGILSLRDNRPQSMEDRVEKYRAIAEQLIEEWQAMMLNGQAEAAIQKLRREAESGDPEALTNLAGALLTHRFPRWPPEPDDVSITLESLVASRKAIAQSPALASAHFNLALALEQLGFTSEARVEFETAATLESDAARSASIRRRAKFFSKRFSVSVSVAATNYIRATASPESRTILKEYLEARERMHDRSQWNAADVNGRLESAAELYASGWSASELLPGVLSQVAMALAPPDQSDLYIERYLIAGGLQLEGRSGEAVTYLRMLDADAFRAHGPAGWTAQIVGEEAIYKIVRRSPAEALDLLRDAFRGSAAEGKSRLTALYASLTDEVRVYLLQSALRDGDLPAALAYTDASVFRPPNGHSGNVHKERFESMLAEIDQRLQDRGIAERDYRVISYGELLAEIEKNDCGDVDSIDAGFIAQPKKSPAQPKKSPAQPKKSFEETQRALTPDAAIVEYATLRDQVIAFVIRENDVQAVFLHPSAADVKNAAVAMRHADDPSFAAAAGLLYELILAPVAAQLEGVSTIAFVAYGDLAGIPFGALLDVQRGQFLIERHAVVHAQSTGAAISASRASKPAREQKVLAIAATDFDRERYPHASALPAARREADSIATLSQCARLLAGPAATPEAIQRQLAENVVIHYAGHIVRRGADVWLPLMPAAGRDGLSATEIARLPLKNARVVVLAACRGASPGEADDVLPTMADAFLMAGVPAVIASSYDVGDTDAPATMRLLHTYLRDGDDAADALRKTTIDELRRGRGVPLSLRFMAIGGAASLAN
jgi:CHAT domain-containing protein